MKQAPAWNQVVADFHGNSDVVFGDVALSKNQVREIHDVAQNPGAGGWPTIRHFNKATGYGGEAYVQKTSSAMCDELGPKETYMQAYVETVGGVSLCNVNASDKGCTEKERAFIEKWKGKEQSELTLQLERLKDLSSKGANSMKPEALQWVKQRLALVKQFTKHGKDEL